MASIKDTKQKKKDRFNTEDIDKVISDITSDSVSSDRVSLYTNNSLAKNEDGKRLSLKNSPSEYIPHNLIYPNPLNEPYMEGITETEFELLKLSIIDNGLHHNLVVIDDGRGRYRLISGEKRWTAISRMTPEEMAEVFPYGIDAKVVPYDPNLTKLDEHIMLLTCNVLIMSAGSPDPRQLKDLIKLYKKKGYVEKDITQYLLNFLDKTKSSIYKTIYEANAIDCLVELNSEGKLTKTALQQLGSLSDELQAAAYEIIINSGLEKIDQEMALAIKKQLKEKEKGVTNNENSPTFIKYDKILNNELNELEKATKIKIENMNYSELSHAVTKLELLNEKIEKMLENAKEELEVKKSGAFTAVSGSKKISE